MIGAVSFGENFVLNIVWIKHWYILGLMLLCSWNVVAHEGHSSFNESGLVPHITESNIDLDKAPLQVSEPSCQVTLDLLDAHSRKPVTGLVRISTTDGKRIQLNGLLSRAAGLSVRSIGEGSFSHMDSWTILPKTATVVLPRAVVNIETLRGPNSLRTMTTVDLRGNSEKDLKLYVHPIAPDWSKRWQAGNTHLHVQQMTLEEAERYSCETAAADGYDIVFFSYLERKGADEHYISNTFTEEDLNRFSKRSGVLFGYGEEYRHNLVDHHQGYGHVMFLELNDLILPASHGQSIMKSGNDDTVLREGIIEAREQHATVLWCHGSRGMEDIPSWLAGLLDVQMIFDQGSLGTYEEALYRYWNLGLKVPVATGTDWFFRDMATVYVLGEDSLTRKKWLENLRKGHSSISNGPLIEFKVEGHPVGNTINVRNDKRVRYQAQILSAHDFGEAQLLINGDVARTVHAKETPNGYVATFNGRQTFEQSSWLAIRS